MGQDWDKLNSQDYITQEQKYLANDYKPIPVVLSKAEGIWVWDKEGKKYLDFLSAYSTVSAGHCNPRIIKALTDQLSNLDIPSRAFFSDRLGPYAEYLCELTGLGKMIPMNTGAEAVETAVKAARRWGYRVKGIPKNKAKIIVSDNNFHGRTTTVISFSTNEKYKEDFGPFDGGFEAVPFGDADALEAAITPETCAFLTEPIQGEGGIIMPPENWLKRVQEICKKHNVLLILDEIQTGLGRTGKNFTWQHYIDKPDGVCLGKALGGGIFPVSAFVARKEIIELFGPGSHGSTFGGNPIGAAVALESLKFLQEENLAEHADELGKYLRQKLRDMNSPLITDVRGKGLLIGMELDGSKVNARDVCIRLKEEGVLCKETRDTIIRFAPPLVIQKDDVDWAMERVEKVMAEFARETSTKKEPALA